MGAGLSINVLGPVTFVADDEVRPVAGAKARAALARLAVDPGAIVPRDELIDALWPSTPPRSPGDVVRVHLSNLRRQLRAVSELDLVVSRADGWTLDVPRDTVDVVRFAAHVAAGSARLQQMSWSDAAREFDEATRLWRGRPFADVRCSVFFDDAAARLEHLRDQAVMGSIEARLQLGDGATLLPLLEQRCAANPLDESAAVAHASALYQAGRSVDALQVARAAIESLATRGLEPSPALRAVEQQVLLHSATPARPSASPDPLTRGRPFEREADARDPHGRPTVASPLLGRAKELAEVLDLLGRHRVVAILGLGGIGKTRLAQEVLDRLDRPVWYLELEQLTTSFQVVGALAACAGLNPAGAGDVLDSRITAELRRTPAVLVFDNCEHLVDDVSTIAARVMAAAPQTTILCTSRIPLPIQGLRTVVLGPLTTGTATSPGPAAEIVIEAAGLRSEEVAERWDVIASACSTGGGLPLALELSGRMLDVAPVGSVDVPPVSPTRVVTPDPIGLAVDTALEDLPPTLVGHLSELALLPDGFSVDVAALVLSVDPREVRYLVEAAHGRGLLVADHRRATARFRPLEPVRTQLVDRRTEAELAAAELRFADVLLSLARAAAPSWMEPVDQPITLRLDDERRNVIALLASEVLDGDRFLEAAMLVPRCWRESARVADAQQLAVAGLDRVDDSDPRRAGLLLGLASASPSLANRLHHVAELDEALALARARHDVDIEMRAMAELAVARGWMGDVAGAFEMLVEVDRRAATLVHPWARCAVNSLMALAAGAAGDPFGGAERLVIEAEQYASHGHLDESMANLNLAATMFRVAGDDERALAVLLRASEYELSRLTAFSHANVAFELARIAVDRGWDDAEARLRRASALLDEYGDHRTALVCRRDLGRWLAAHDQRDEADAVLRASVRPLLSLDQRAAAVALGALASLHAGDPRVASTLAAAALARVDGTGAPLDPLEQDVVDQVAPLAARIPCELDDPHLVEVLDSCACGGAERSGRRVPPLGPQDQKHS